MLVIILGLLSSASVLLASISTKRTPLLVFSLITSVLSIAQFGLVGALVGVGTASIGIIRNGSLLLAEKQPDRFGWFKSWMLAPVFILSHIAMFSYVNDWDNISLVAFAPLLGSILGVIALTFSNMIVTKSIILFTHFLWMGYELHAQTYGMLVGEVANVIATTTAIVLIARSRGAVDTTGAISDALTAAITTVITVPTQAITQSITTITSAIPVITTKLPVIYNETAAVNLSGVHEEAVEEDFSLDDETSEVTPSPPKTPTTTTETLVKLQTSEVTITKRDDEATIIPPVIDQTPDWLDLPSAGTKPLLQLPKA